MNSTIDVISVALAGGAYAGGLSIGAAEANNYIGYDSSGNKTASNVKAYITGSNALVAAELNQSATSNASVTTEVIAGSAAAAAGPLGALAAAGAGVNTVNRIGQTIQSYVTNSTGNGVLSHAGSVTATDNSTINATAGAAAVAAAIGLGGGFSVSVALAGNVTV